MQATQQGAAVDKYRKALAAERVLFAMLVAAMGAAGFFYKWFQSALPDWQLIGLVIAGMCACGAVCFFAANFVVRYLKR